MPLRTSWDSEDQPISAAAASTATMKKATARSTTTATRIPQHRAAKAQSIEATARILRPTRASLARTTTKRLTRDAREQAEVRKVERKRRELARVAKQNGRLTVPMSPKFRSQARKKTSAALLTMTSRELLEIDAIRKRVQETRKKVRKYHEASTRSVLSVSTTAAASTTSTTTVSGAKASFAMALRSCGGLGVPAVRRAKLTQPIGFEFEIDKRLALRKRASMSSSDSNNSRDATAASSEAQHAGGSSSEPASKRRRHG